MYGGCLVDYKMWLCTQGKKVAKFELGPKDILASLLLDQQLFAQSCALDQFTKKHKTRMQDYKTHTIDKNNRILLSKRVVVQKSKYKKQKHIIMTSSMVIVHLLKGLIRTNAQMIYDH